MRPGQVDRSTAVAVATRQAAAPRDAEDWSSRLFAGLRVAAVPASVREALASALGEMGVEAEYFLALLRSFGGPGPQPHAKIDDQARMVVLQTREFVRAGAAEPNIDGDDRRNA